MSDGNTDNADHPFRRLAYRIVKELDERYKLKLFGADWMVLENLIVEIITDESRNV